MRILLVASASPDPFGTGWNRRVYQLVHDLRRSCRAEVEVFEPSQASQEARETGGASKRRLLLARLKDRCTSEARRIAANPLRILKRRMVFSTDGLGGDALARLEHFVEQRGPFDALICDNASYAGAVSLMEARGTPSYYALHHIESLAFNQNALLEATRGRHSGTGRPSRDLMVLCGDLADEIAALARARKVFAISRLEQEFLSATGISAEFYPYAPVGEVLGWCKTIRQAREQAGPSGSRVFLSSATANAHNVANLSVVVRELLASGMPPGCTFLITGIEQQELVRHVPELAAQGAARGIRVLGKIPGDEFEQLLVSAVALVVPKYCGFGALTRLADATACGIPIITNVRQANGGETWHVDGRKGWREAMERLLSGQRAEAASERNGEADPARSPLGEVAAARQFESGSRSLGDMRFPQAAPGA